MISTFNALSANNIVFFGNVRRPHPATDHKIIVEFPVMQLRSKEMDGGKGQKYDYLYIHRTAEKPLPVMKKGEIMNDRRYEVPAGLRVLPLVKDKKGRDNIVLIFEKRPSTEGIFDVCVTIPGGGIGKKNEKETIEEAAGAELLEEAGYKFNSNKKITIFNPITIKDVSANSDIQSFVKAEGLEKIPNFTLGEDVVERKLFARKPMLVPIDKIDNQLDEWTRNGIVINGKRTSCAVSSDVLAALYFYNRDKEKNALKA